MKITKEELLNAMNIILQEYKNKTHDSDENTCALCKLYFNDDNRPKQCINCPMSVFGEKGFHSYSCLNRKCRPFTSKFEFLKTKKTKAVVSFYENAIKTIEQLSEEDLNKSNAFEFLVAIDETIAKKHKL